MRFMLKFVALSFAQWWEMLEVPLTFTQLFIACATSQLLYVVNKPQDNPVVN